MKETSISDHLSLILDKDDIDRKDDITYLLSLNDPEEIRALFRKADQVRKKYCGDEVHLRGIIEISNYCSENCLYCGIRKGNHPLPRYRMTAGEIIEISHQIIDSGIRTVVLQSGEDKGMSADQVSYIIKEIKKIDDAAVTLSLGERDFSDYTQWRDAGADRYLLKHETANPVLYSFFHNRQPLSERIDHLVFLKNAGFQTGSGNLVGLPGQSYSDIAEDILLCRELDVDMASFSPFISSPNTPFRDLADCPVDHILKVMAVARVVLKNVHIPATTALATIDPAGRERGLAAGANVIMPNFTPPQYRNKYDVYPNKKRVSDGPSFCVSSLAQMLQSLGRRASFARGDTLKPQI